ncbi:MAG: hypothetical protein ACRD16_02135, partial [Thermoanaerobaculia bacterium]
MGETVGRLLRLWFGVSEQRSDLAVNLVFALHGTDPRIPCRLPEPDPQDGQDALGALGRSSLLEDRGPRTRGKIRLESRAIPEPRPDRVDPELALDIVRGESCSGFRSNQHHGVILGLPGRVEEKPMRQVSDVELGSKRRQDQWRAVTNVGEAAEGRIREQSPSRGREFMDKAIRQLVLGDHRPALWPAVGPR